MMATLKAEFKKLLSVRSTYFTVLLALLLVGFLSFYVQGFVNTKTDMSPLFLAGTITQAGSVIAIFGAVIALLLVTHEYRYNTIVYTLTASNSRSKVLTSKIITILSFIFVYSLAMTVIALGLVALGASMAHHALVHQDINYLSYVTKSVVYCEGYAMAAFVFAVLIRNQIGAIVALFIIPGTVEGLLSLLFKQNSIYMPFTALAQIISPPTLVNAPRRIAETGALSPGKGALVFSAYLAVGLAVSWYLFLKRDAG